MILYQQLEAEQTKYTVNVTSSIMNILKCLLLIGDYQEAVSAGDEYVKISRALRLPVSEELSKVHNFAGQAKWELDFKNEAVEDFMEAIDIQSMILGKSHPDVVKGFNNIGVYYNNLGFNE